MEISVCIYEVNASIFEQKQLVEEEICFSTERLREKEWIFKGHFNGDNRFQLREITVEMLHLISFNSRSILLTTWQNGTWRMLHQLHLILQYMEAVYAQLTGKKFQLMKLSLPLSLHSFPNGLQIEFH